MLHTIKSIKLHAPGNIFIDEILYPGKAQDHVLIKVESVGICGSDIGAYRGANPLITYPRVIGHEVIGRIIASGDGLPDDIKEGDRVIVDPYLYCNHCYPCKIGRTNCCESLKVIGVHIDGGMQEIFAHPAKLVHKVPDTIPPEHAPLIEPLTIALHALHRAKLKAREHIVIIGAGTIGLMAALVAKYYQAVPVIIDLLDARLRHASACGISLTLNPLRNDISAEIARLTNGRMAEVVIEASGASQSIQATLDYSAFAGRISLTGWPGTATVLKTNLITFKELDLRGARTSAGEFKEAIALLASGEIAAADIISKIITFSDIPAMVKVLASHPEQYLKVNALLTM